MKGGDYMTKETKTKQKKGEKAKSNFDSVAQGKCPHDNAKLRDEVVGRKVGVTRVCSKCKHV